MKNKDIINVLAELLAILDYRIGGEDLTHYTYYEELAMEMGNLMLHKLKEEDRNEVASNRARK